MIEQINALVNSYCTTIQGCIQGIYNLIVALAVVVAFIMFIIGAFKNLLSVVPDVKMEGKNQMRNSIIGLIVIFSSGVLLYWINPEIFNARLLMFRVDLSLPKVDISIENITFNYSVNGFNLNIPTYKISRAEINRLINMNCVSERILVRLTNYYIPIFSEDKNIHKFLSNTTLQGTGFLIQDSIIKGLNAQNAKDILYKTKKQGKNLDICKNEWLWSWIEVKGNRPKSCIMAKSNPKESVESEDVLYPNQAINLAFEKSKEVKSGIYGAYGPLIPRITVAYNPDQKVFKKFEALKVLDCYRDPTTKINCNPNFSKILIVTDIGKGAQNGAKAWLDLFAGIGEKELENTKSITPPYIEVCKVANVSLN